MQIFGSFDAGKAPASCIPDLGMAAPQRRTIEQPTVSDMVKYHSPATTNTFAVNSIGSSELI
jgi:hypothetical protein